MHRRHQFGMRENPASDRRHGSRSALQEDLSAATTRHASHHQEMLVTSAGPVESATTEDFATEERREEGANSTKIEGSIKVPGNTESGAGAGHHADGQEQRTRSDAEFEPLLDVAEAARLLRIHPKTLRVKAGHGIIPGIQIGRVWRFRASTLNRWLEKITRQRMVWRVNEMHRPFCTIQIFCTGLSVPFKQRRNFV